MKTAFLAKGGGGGGGGDNENLPPPPPPPEWKFSPPLLTAIWKTLLTQITTLQRNLSPHSGYYSQTCLNEHLFKVTICP